MSEWISVNQKLPDNGENVLTINNFGTCEVRGYSKYSNDWLGPYGGVYESNIAMLKIMPSIRPAKITHWMPLPAAPVAQKEQE